MSLASVWSEKDCGGTVQPGDCLWSGAGRETAENAGISRNSTEVVPAANDLEPASSGRQPEPVSGSRGTDANQRCVAGRLHLHSAGDADIEQPARLPGTLDETVSAADRGWEYGNSISEDLVLNVLRRAIQEYQPGVSSSPNTNRSRQYASHRYRDVLRKSRIQQNMNGAKSCYDNAFMESCFGTMKTELELAEYENIPGAP